MSGQFILRPQIVTAIQWTGANADEFAAHYNQFNGVVTVNDDGTLLINFSNYYQYIVPVNGWIVTQGPSGTVYDNATFVATYAVAPSGSPLVFNTSVDTGPQPAAVV